jgi:hypothetical protein
MSPIVIIMGGYVKHYFTNSPVLGREILLKHERTGIL